ncbi:MAG: DUF2851 family protein [Rikenellaceae bacterium]
MEEVATDSKQVNIDPKTLLDLVLSGAKERRCGIYLHHLEGLDRHRIYQELETERLDDKFLRIQDLYARSQSNWNQIFLIGLLNSISDMNNRENYQEVGHMVHFSIIQRERASLRNIEALLIGASGLLDTLPQDSFTTEFRKSAEFMLYKYQITPIYSKMWNLKKITAVKHPIIRLSQIARLLYENEFPFNHLVNFQNRNDIISFFNVEASMEWCLRVKGGAKSASHIGVSKCDLIGINFVVPMLYAYGLYTADDSITDRAGYINETLPAESNFYITSWRKRGLTPQSAYETQALIQLAKVYCDNHLCEKCHIYKHMLSPYSILPKLPIFVEHMR